MNNKNKKVSLDPIQVGADYTVSEEVKKVLSVNELTEEKGDKLVTLFETAVNEQVKKSLETLNEEYSVKVKEVINEAREEMVENISDYLDYVVEDFIKENKKELKESVLNARNNTIIEGVVDLLKANYVEIPEGRQDIVDQLEETINELRQELSEEESSNMTLRNELNGRTCQEHFNRLSEGLAETEVENFHTLVEDLSIDDPDVFAKKAKIIRESYFKNGLKKDKKLDEKELGESKKVDDSDFMSRTMRLFQSR